MNHHPRHLFPPRAAILLAACLPAFATFACAKEFSALSISPEIVVGGTTLRTDALPSGLKLHRDLGLVGVDALAGSVIHRTTSRILETRGLKTPGGDYLVMFPEGDHYANNKGRRKVNVLQAYRSSDGGRTWIGPVEAFDIDYSQHGFIPFVPRNSKRIYAFGTQPNPDLGYSWKDGEQENAPIGYRWSDDDGRTWSKVNPIRPTNDPGFMGMSVMRMTETDAGTWLIGSHVAHWAVKPITTEQYLLRSTDRGETWELLPGKRPSGWFVKPYHRMDEVRPLNLGNGKVLAMARTPAGSLFLSRSEDDGKTWSEFAPSPLVHPGAPPMLFHLRDGKTLIAFHHNRVPVGQDERLPQGSLDPHAENMKVRSEIWFSTSRDGGLTWSESRFLFANAVQPNLKIKAWNHQCSYVDMFVDGDDLHLIVPHRWQQVLHLVIPESALAALPTKAELAARARSASTAKP